MPMNMGIHCKPISYNHLVSLDSRIRGNDEGIFFLKNALVVRPFLCKFAQNGWGGVYASPPSFCASLYFILI